MSSTAKRPYDRPDARGGGSARGSSRGGRGGRGGAASSRDDRPAKEPFKPKEGYIASGLKL